MSSVPECLARMSECLARMSEYVEWRKANVGADDFDKYLMNRYKAWSRAQLDKEQSLQDRRDREKAERYEGRVKGRRYGI